MNIKIPELCAEERKCAIILADIVDECGRQRVKWGAQCHPDGTEDSDTTRWQRDFDRALVDDAADGGTLTWRAILQEEVSEAFAETDLANLRKELIQAAAVIVTWIADIDSRQETARQ